MEKYQFRLMKVKTIRHHFRVNIEQLSSYSIFVSSQTDKPTCQAVSLREVSYYIRMRSASQ